MNETYNLLISKDYLKNQNLGKGKNVTFFVPNSNYLLFNDYHSLGQKVHGPDVPFHLLLRDGG